MGKLESNKKKKEDALYNTAFELFICISKINMISETNWPLPKRRIYFSLHIWLFVRIRSQVFLLSSIL